MAKLVNLLTIKKNGRTWRCASYTTQGEATPSGGECLEVRNNGVKAFFALSPDGDTPLSVRKNENVYHLQTEIKYGTVVITVPELHNQSIKLTYVDENGNTQTVITKTKQSFIARYNTPYSVELIPDEGYTAGSLTGSALSGYTLETLGWSEGAGATLKPVLVTVSINSNCVVYIDGELVTSSFTANMGDTFTIYCEPPVGYKIDSILVNETPFTNGGKYTVRGAVTIECQASLKKYSFVVGSTTNQTYVLKLGETTYPATFNQSTYSVAHGTVYSIQYIAKEDDDVWHYVASDNVNGVVTENVSIEAKSAGLIPIEDTIEHYNVTFTKNANCAYRMKDSDGQIVAFVGMGEGTQTYIGNKGETYTLETTELAEGFTFSEFIINEV